MSFSQTVKDEILKNLKKLGGCCATSFLTAVLRSAGSVCLDSFGYGFSVESDNGAFLDFCVNLAQKEFDVGSAMYEIRQTSKDFESVKYICKFDIELGKKIGLIADDDIHFSDNLPKLQNDCCKKAFMQGLFLSCGSVSVPESDVAFASAHGNNYHLEMRFANADFADFVEDRFAEIGFKKTLRKTITVLYLKGGEKIADFFVYVGAVNAKFKLENIIIERSFRNNANRQSNCIDSNIDKAVSAGLKQCAAIDKLISDGDFQTLPSQLKEIALARKQHPEATLAELAATLGISKSGANHRLAKIVELADKNITQNKR